ncbi:hypothetical protein [Thalassospira alkalitolerans]|uniref:hypothetical protein n=1 Tax=Thalassospira alkalitolerans TaxID=1293890 RepID=UPI003AA936F2
MQTIFDKTKPDGGDLATTLDDSIREFKTDLKSVLPLINEAVTTTPARINGGVAVIDNMLKNLEPLVNQIAATKQKVTDAKTTLEQKTAQEYGALENLPSGFVFPYKGDLSDLPSNYQKTDGANSTPAMEANPASGISAFIMKTGD